MRKCQTCSETFLLPTGACPRCGADYPTMRLENRTWVYAAQAIGLLIFLGGSMLWGYLGE